MTRKTPSDFTSHDDWLSHVRREIAVSDQPYALAFGRMELFRSFYRMQGLAVPSSVCSRNLSASRCFRTQSGRLHWRL